jgi:hypothetical protein
LKKYAGILSAVVLLLGFVAISYSAPAEIPSDTTAAVAKGQTKITLGGDIRVRGFAIKNGEVLDKESYPTTNANSPNQNYLDYRVQLRIKAEVSPNTTGYIMLQSGTESLPYVIYGSQQGGARGVYQVGNTKESQIWIHTAYIQYQGSGLLGVPAGIKLGRDIIIVGNGLFLYHDRMGDDQIMAYVQPVKELTLALATVKFREGNSDLSDDATAYVLLGSYKGKNFELSADVTYIDDQGNKDSTVDRGYSKWKMNSIFGKDSDIHLWNFGLRGNVDDIAGTGIGAKADIELQTGKILNTASTYYGGYEPKFKGWAGLAGLNYKFKTMPLTLKAEYQVGSGHGDSKDIKEYVTAIGRLENAYTTFVYENFARSACDSALARYSKMTGLCNTQYVIFGGAGDITKSLSAQLYGFWIRANKAVNINGYKDKSKDVGYEVDTMITYKIEKNLKYWIEAGYFWPGDAWKLKNGKDPDNAWAIRHNIMVTF